jgi:hypothetical protein
MTDSPTVFDLLIDSINCTACSYAEIFDEKDYGVRESVNIRDHEKLYELCMLSATLWVRLAKIFNDKENHTYAYIKLFEKAKIIEEELYSSETL